MKIVIDARESGTTTGRYVDKLIEHLAKLSLKHHVIVLTKSPRLGYFKQVAPNFEAQAADYKEFSFFGEQLALAWRLYRLRPDLVHFSMPQQPLLYLGPSVTTIHDLTTLRFSNPSKNRLIFGFKQRVYGLVVRRAINQSRRLIAISEYTKNDLLSLAHLKHLAKVDVIYEAADKIAEPAQPVAGLKKDGFIMYVGRPQPHKNLDRLVDAFAKLKESHPALQLVFVGKKDALYKQLEQSVTKKALPDVLFTDFINDGQLRWLYENTAAYVFASLAEGFGLPGLEAMVQGAPVVSSNATCLPEIYGEAALYFDPTNIDDMASKISTVLDNPSIRAEIISKGRLQAAKYSWQKTAEQTLSTYEKALPAKTS